MNIDPVQVPSRDFMPIDECIPQEIVFSPVDWSKATFDPATSGESSEENEPWVDLYNVEIYEWNEPSNVFCDLATMHEKGPFRIYGEVLSSDVKEKGAQEAYEKFGTNRATMPIVIKQNDSWGTRSICWSFSFPDSMKGSDFGIWITSDRASFRIMTVSRNYADSNLWNSLVEKVAVIGWAEDILSANIKMKKTLKDEEVINYVALKLGLRNWEIFIRLRRHKDFCLQQLCRRFPRSARSLNFYRFLQQKIENHIGRDPREAYKDAILYSKLPSTFNSSTMATSTNVSLKRKSSTPPSSRLLTPSSHPEYSIPLIPPNTHLPQKRKTTPPVSSHLIASKLEEPSVRPYKRARTSLTPKLQPDSQTSTSDMTSEELNRVKRKKYTNQRLKKEFKFWAPMPCWNSDFGEVLPIFNGQGFWTCKLPSCQEDIYKEDFEDETSTLQAIYNHIENHKIELQDLKATDRWVKLLDYKVAMDRGEKNMDDENNSPGRFLSFPNKIGFDPHKKKLSASIPLDSLPNSNRSLVSQGTKSSHKSNPKPNSISPRQLNLPPTQHRLAKLKDPETDLNIHSNTDIERDMHGIQNNVRKVDSLSRKMFNDKSVGRRYLNDRPLAMSEDIISMPSDLLDYLISKSYPLESSEESPYSCMLGCGNRFDTPQELKIHLQTKGLTEGVWKYVEELLKNEVPPIAQAAGGFQNDNIVLPMPTKAFNGVITSISDPPEIQKELNTASQNSILSPSQNSDDFIRTNQLGYLIGIPDHKSSPAISSNATVTPLSSTLITASDIESETSPKREEQKKLEFLRALISRINEENIKPEKDPSYTVLTSELPANMANGIQNPYEKNPHNSISVSTIAPASISSVPYIATAKKNLKRETKRCGNIDSLNDFVEPTFSLKKKNFDGASSEICPISQSSLQNTDKIFQVQSTMTLTQKGGVSQRLPTQTSESSTYHHQRTIADLFSSVAVAEAFVPPTSWACPSCTLDNPPTQYICVMCDSHRPNMKLWPCMQCTYENREPNLTCEMCGHPKDEQDLQKRNLNVF